MRMNDEIDADTFRKKQADLNAAIHRLQQATKPAQGVPAASLAAKALEASELSQTLADTWLNATPLQKRRLTEKVAFELTLDATTLSATMRKPFDVLAEGLKTQNGRGERI